MHYSSNSKDLRLTSYSLPMAKLLQVDAAISSTGYPYSPIAGFSSSIVPGSDADYSSFMTSSWSSDCSPQAWNYYLQHLRPTFAIDFTAVSCPLNPLARELHPYVVASDGRTGALSGSRCPS